MIKVILSGGLGNQMFQYAAARALGLRLNTGVAIDLYNLNKKSETINRNYGLNVFELEVENTCSLKDKFIIKCYRYHNCNQAVKNIFRLFKVFYDERANVFDLGFESLKPGSVLMGYFQNEYYFKNYPDIIRSDFRFKYKLQDKNLEIEHTIKTTDSVSMHIRRGDYIYPGTNLLCLGLDYYRKAIDYIAGKIKNPHFFIFSDDMDWVRQNLILDKYKFTFVDWNTGDSSYIDMQLISICKNNIIANSSFSWWGAWLNSNYDKIVVAPAVWYKNEKEYNYPDGFIPASWVIL